MRSLVLVLGDQLTHGSPAFDGFDPRRDRILMIEAPGEATHVWSHKARIALFLSAMRHFAAELRERGLPVDHVRLGDGEAPGLGERLRVALVRLAPERLIVVEPGEWRVLATVQDAARAAHVPLEIRADSHFLCPREAFERWARGKRTLVMEPFYRLMRRRTGVLMQGGAPAGGAWNFDRANRAAFGRSGPGAVPEPPRFAPDATTRETLAEVDARFARHPGSLASFAWPVTRADALAALAAFVRDRLPGFGRVQDAMWTGMPFGWHSALSAALNLKLLDPREVIAAAEAAWREGRVPIASAEGFVRQVLGWREFIRGVYWLDMPGLAEANHYGHTAPLPAWYWTGKTRMRCMRETIGQTLEHGYAHHIQRLMVTGNFALTAGIAPRQVADWYLAVYVDAVEWAELPNTVGMALHANGGRFTTKPYAASGAYVKRMSNYCQGCAYRPEVRHGPGACPLTTLYWDFLDRNEASLAANTRTALAIRSLARLDGRERRAIRAEAGRMRAALDRL
ncbi:MAG: cryptochrome/photolyase family protein [Burkholderiales bacterium]|nr:cryptochrome/photolyase family protein [Burkholderiales bacterium]